MSTDAATRSARARFQSGLLAWLRQPGDPAGLREMIAVLRELAREQPQSGDAFVWRSAEAFLASLLDGRLAADDGARRMCRRIERHLSSRNADGSADGDLRDALFAYLSGRAGVTPGSTDPGADAGDSAAGAAPEADATATAPAIPALDLAGLQKAMGSSLARTAELLPLIAGGMTPRHTPEQVAAWADATRALDFAWQECLRNRADDCRRATTQLVAAALRLNTAASLRLAESLADACATAEAASARQFPALRAALAAALEIAGDRDGPNHVHFDQRAAAAASRLDQAVTAARRG